MSPSVCPMYSTSFWLPLPPHRTTLCSPSQAGPGYSGRFWTQGNPSASLFECWDYGVGFRKYTIMLVSILFSKNCMWCNPWRSVSSHRGQELSHSYVSFLGCLRNLFYCRIDSGLGVWLASTPPKRIDMYYVITQTLSFITHFLLCD